MSKTALCEREFTAPIEVLCYEATFPEVVARSTNWLVGGTFRSTAQMMRIMRMLTFLFFAASLTVSARSSSQNITLAGKDLSLKKVFSVIEKQSGFFVLANRELLAASTPVSLAVSNMPLLEFLNLLLIDQPIMYKLEGKTIVLYEKPLTDVLVSSDQPTMAFASLVGRLLDSETKDALGSASISVKGTKVGTSSDASGNFTLSGFADDAVLVISTVGYASLEISYKKILALTIGGSLMSAENKIIKSTNGDIVFYLTKKLNVLDETVVLGYSMSTKRFSTANVGTIKGSDIEKQPVSNPLAALYGRIPGITVTQQSGVPGGNFHVQIRGQNSLRNSADDNGNAPLYLIDGVPFNPGSMKHRLVTSMFPESGPAGGVSPFNTINPADIASIEILKNADATAIYGSRGANGVVLITTKTGQSGNTQVDLTVRKGVGKITRTLNLLEIDDYLKMRREAYQNAGVAIPASAHDLNGNWEPTKNINWQKELLQNNGGYSDVLLSISGGNPNTQYRIGGGYHKEQMVIPGDFGEWRGSGQISISNISSNKKMKSQASVSFSRGKGNFIATDITTKVITLAPNTPDLIDKNHQLLFPIGISLSPLAYYGSDYDANTFNMISSVAMSYELFKGFQLKLNGGYNNMGRNDLSTEPNTIYPESLRANTASYLRLGDAKTESWSLEPQFHFQTTIRAHRIVALAGASFQNESRKNNFQSASGFVSKQLLKNITAYPTTSFSNEYLDELYRYNAVFGRIEYVNNARYVLNVSGRRDGSSRFGPGRQFSNFAAVGAAWIFSEESFFTRSRSVLSFGKLRGSYGSTGSDQTKNYGFLDLYGPTGTYQRIPALAPTQLFNNDYAWEINRKLELGMELGFVDNKLLFNLSWYRNRSSNQLVGYPLPPSSGFPSIPRNMDAVVQNTGIEVELSYRKVWNNNVQWNASLNLTVPRNKLISYPDLINSSYAQTYAVGHPLTIKKLYNYLGVNTQTGIYEVEDVNRDQLYNSLDQVAILNIGQQWYGGIYNSFKWRHFQMDILFQFIKQKGVNYLSSFPGGAPGIAINNQPKEVMGRWQKPGDVVDIQKFSTLLSTNYRLFTSSSASVSDASFGRLKNLSIHYEIPARLLSKGFVKGITVGVEAQNLLTLTSYRGLDPESQSIMQPPLRVIAGMARFKF